MSKKIVIKLGVCDDKGKRKAMKVVSVLEGIDSMEVDVKEGKMTVTGVVDPVDVMGKLRKCWPGTQIVSVGPKEEKKDGDKKDGDKKEGDKKKEDEEKKKKEAEKMMKELVEAYKAYNPCLTTQYFVQSADENPNACAIL